MNEIEYLRRLYITFIMGVKSKHAGRFYRYLPTQLGREPNIITHPETDGHQRGLKFENKYPVPLSHSLPPHQSVPQPI